MHSFVGSKSPGVLQQPPMRFGLAPVSSSPATTRHTSDAGDGDTAANLKTHSPHAIAALQRPSLSVSSSSIVHGERWATSILAGGGVSPEELRFARHQLQNGDIEADTYEEILDRHYEQKEAIRQQMQVSQREKLAAAAAAAAASRAPDGVVIPANNFHLQYLADFLTAAECDEFIQLAESEGYARSRVGTSAGMGFVSPNRTSFSASIHGAEWDSSAMASLKRRVCALVGRSPSSSSFTWQVDVVRYEVGQKFHEHYDSTQRMDTPRQYTLFVYLNDVAQGGETHFPLLDWKVKPKRGAALFWENHATRHSAHHFGSLHAGLPVLKGVKVRHRASSYQGGDAAWWNHVRADFSVRRRSFVSPRLCDSTA